LLKGRFNVLVLWLKPFASTLKRALSLSCSTNRAVNGRGYLPRNAESLSKQAERNGNTTEKNTNFHQSDRRKTPKYTKFLKNYTKKTANYTKF